MTESGAIADMERTALSQCSGYTFTYVESGEVALAEIAKAIAARLGLGAPQSWSAEQAIAAWGQTLVCLENAGFSSAGIWTLCAGAPIALP